MTGDEAVAYAVKQSDVDFISAHPITPQTIIVERLSEYVASGQVDAAFVPVESEHSALSACIGASLCGARVFTSTSSQGLALMHEIMYVASGLRCPIVMAVANRALSAPLNIHGDHSDIMGSRDSGWVRHSAKARRKPTTTQYRPSASQSTRKSSCLSPSTLTASQSPTAVNPLKPYRTTK
jgi:pyruvate ferredoxin oxidoreductase alpha subunit